MKERRKTNFEEIFDCVPPHENRRGYLVSGVFFVAIALNLYKLETWWRCTGHADAKGPLEVWQDAFRSHLVAAILALAAAAELGVRAYHKGFAPRAVFGSENAVTYAILAFVAVADVLVRRHQPKHVARVTSTALAVAALGEALWFSFNSTGTGAMGRLLIFLQISAGASALALVAQAAFPSSNLRCAACYFLALQGVVCLDAGLWLFNTGWSPGCFSNEALQLAAADRHAQLDAAAVTVFFAAGFSIAYWWAIHVQKTTMAECRAIMTAAGPRSHE